MKNLKQNPDLLHIEREIDKERQMLMSALIKNEPVMVVTYQLKKVLKLGEQKKKLKPFIVV